MASFNQWIGLGYVTRDPELRYTPKGDALVQFGVGCNHKWRNADGQERQETLFMDCTAWRKTAEIIGQYVKKGSLVMVQGRLTEDSWDDKQTGQKRFKIKCTVETIQFCDRPPERGGGGDGPPASQSYRRTAPAPAAVGASAPAPSDNDAPAAGADDDVPF